VNRELVGTGNALQLMNLGEYEGRLEEGDRGALELDLRLPVSDGVARELESRLIQAGVTDARVVTGSPLLRIYWTKGMPWLAVIAAVIVGLIVILILVLGFRLFREVVAVIPPVPLTIGLIALSVLGIMVLSRRKST